MLVEWSYESKVGSTLSVETCCAARPLCSRFLAGLHVLASQLRQSRVAWASLEASASRGSVAVVCWCRGAVSAWAYHLSSWRYLRGICRRENVVPSLDSWAMVISWSILPILQYYLIERWPFLEFWGLRFFFGFTLFTINLIVFLYYLIIQ